MRREWENARRVEVNERYYQDLLSRYTVTIDGLELLDGGMSLASAEPR